MSTFNSRVGNEKIEEVLKKNDTVVFFLGVGGVGMSALCEMLFSRGITVVGSDRNLESSTVKRLREIGISVYPENSIVRGLSFDMLVYTLAVDSNNRLFEVAREKGALLVSRAELLGTLMRGYGRRICVAGSHGKSTTTALVDTLLSCSGCEPTTVSGAMLSTGSSLRLGRRAYLVAEACEYKNSFLLFHPTAAIVTSVELDHTDFFSDLGMIRRSFLDFINLCRDFVLINGECENIKAIKKDITVPFYTYGSGKECDFVYNIVRREKGKRTFVLACRGRRIGEFDIPTIADYVVEDAVAALSVLYLYGVEIEKIRKALKNFSATARRLEVIGSLGNRPIIYDYAHHPTEIRKTILAVKNEYGKCTVVFRPHTYTRTAALWEDFRSALSLADYTVLLDVFAAREDAIEGVTSAALAEKIEGAVRLDFDAVYTYVKDKTEGAIILMGAGDIEIIKQDFLVESKH